MLPSGASSISFGDVDSFLMLTVFLMRGLIPHPRSGVVRF